MASKETLDALANRIRLGIDESGLHSMFKEDLEKLWMQNQEISADEKSMLIMNFAVVYGFKVEVMGDATSAIFYPLK